MENTSGAYREVGKARKSELPGFAGIRGLPGETQRRQTEQES